MKQVDAAKRGTYDRQIPVQIRQEFRGAMDCNGNGLCFNFDVKSQMCPSMKISRQRVHSPKGRATLVREWLRLLAEQGVTPEQIEKGVKSESPSLRGLIEKTRNSWRAKQGDYDFSHEVKESMSGCLACKACSTQCPIKIDVPSFRAKFLALYHSRYLRPVRDHIVANVEASAPLMSKAPGVFNFFLRQTVVQKLSEHTIGMVDLPLFSQPTLKQELSGHAATSLTLEQLEGMSVSQREKHVLVVQDPFTSYYDAKVVVDFVHLIEKLGYKPVLLPFSPNGKAQHIKGFLSRFAKTARKTSDFLNRVAKLQLPMVGVDPALVLCYRDEYHEILGEEQCQFTVMLAHEWLISLPEQTKNDGTDEQPWYLFGHCTESTALPNSANQWAALFSRYGRKLTNVSVGCCGMAGTYGHEVANLSNSKGIYNLSWKPAIEKLPLERCLSSGYSCRSQVKRMEKTAIKHPIQALLEIVS